MNAQIVNHELGYRDFKRDLQKLPLLFSSSALLEFFKQNKQYILGTTNLAKLSKAIENILEI